MTSTEPNTVVADIAAHATRLCEADGRLTVTMPNRFGGLDLEDENGTIVRITEDDPEPGVEVYVMDTRRVSRAQARLSGGFPAAAVAGLIRAAFTA